MAKKRARSAPPAAAAAATEASEAAAAAAARVRRGAYCVRSSLAAPFLVVSPNQLVGSLQAPKADDWREIKALAADLVKQWEARGAAVLADFEGSLMGIEGVPLTAAFQRTFVLDGKSLRPLADLKGPLCKDMGLFVDLTHPEGAAVVKQVMESTNIAKVIWGADKDTLALRYAPVAQPLGIEPKRLIDAQLGFSKPGTRLSMAKMLERVPEKLKAGLPSKDSVDFDKAHAFNEHALSLPMEETALRYALDDVHRLDAVLRSQTPRNGTFQEAQTRTLVLTSQLLSRPELASADELRFLDKRLGEADGLARQAAAVRVRRLLAAARRVFPKECEEGGVLSGFGGLEWEAGEVLRQAGVKLPADLSFQAPGEGKTRAEEVVAKGLEAPEEPPAKRAKVEVEEAAAAEQQAQEDQLEEERAREGKAEKAAAPEERAQEAKAEESAGKETAVAAPVPAAEEAAPAAAAEEAAPAAASPVAPAGEAAPVAADETPEEEVAAGKKGKRRKKRPSAAAAPAEAEAATAAPAAAPAAPVEASEEVQEAKEEAKEEGPAKGKKKRRKSAGVA